MVRWKFTYVSYCVTASVISVAAVMLMEAAGFCDTSAYFCQPARHYILADNNFLTRNKSKIKVILFVFTIVLIHSCFSSTYIFVLLYSDALSFTFVILILISTSSFFEIWVKNHLTGALSLLEFFSVNRPADLTTHVIVPSVAIAGKVTTPNFPLVSLGSNLHITNLNLFQLGTPTSAVITSYFLWRQSTVKAFTYRLLNWLPSVRYSVIGGLLLSVQGVTGTADQLTECDRDCWSAYRCDRDCWSAYRVWSGLLISLQSVTGTAGQLTGCDRDCWSAYSVWPGLLISLQSVTGTAGQLTGCDRDCWSAYSVWPGLLIRLQGVTWTAD